jgi:hypothetical protein
MHQGLAEPEPEGRLTMCSSAAPDGGKKFKVFKVFKGTDQ